MTTPLPVEDLLATLTLEEKASLLSGSDFWHTEAVARDGVELVPSVMLTDGPHGLRKQRAGGDHLGLGTSVPATCFPTAVTLGSTWDPDLVARVGEALGRESAANDVAVLLGPGANIKRDPRCGRNFEYLSEDPVLSGDLAAALIRGVQSQGVGTSLKHFAANNQESDRMRVSADVDERTLREIYLTSFERAVAAGPWTVMCAYNKVNDVYASQNHWLLTQVLRQEWGWDGLVVSDWGAVRDRVAALAAGLDLEMPASGGRTDAQVVAAVRDGHLDEAVVDAAVRNVLALLNRTLAAVRTPASYDADAHHALAREAAAAGAVLLKNEPVAAAGDAPSGAAPLLPLTGPFAVVGEFARTPRYQGAGSSLVNPTQLDTALAALGAALGQEVPFAPGFTIAAGPAGDDDTLRAEAVALAAQSPTVVLFLGLPAEGESEGFDRTTLDLPAAQRRVLEEVVAVNPRTVVVLSNGGVVTTEWAEQVPAVLELWLGGQAGGGAAADLLLGAVSPSGKLAETVPRSLEQTPAFGNFPGAFGHVRYGEGVLVGYRWYDTRAFVPAFPFGHGLSYTAFEIDDVEADVTGEGAGTRVSVSARVTNTGRRPGAQVVQVYVHDPVAAVPRPEQELKGFAKVFLDPGASERVTFDLDSRALAFWHPVAQRWVVESGPVEVRVGASSRDIAAAVPLTVIGEEVTLPLTPMSTMAEVAANPVVGAAVRAQLDALTPELRAMADDMPMQLIVDFGLGPMSQEDLEALLAAGNSGGA